jgi:hypothetical protein
VIVARGTTTQLAVGWPAGLAAVCVTLLVAPGDATTQVAIAFLVGQAVALTLMTVLAARTRSAGLPQRPERRRHFSRVASVVQPN